LTTVIPNADKKDVEAELKAAVAGCTTKPPKTADAMRVCVRSQLNS
jgi:hypothetical protein